MKLYPEGTILAGLGPVFLICLVVLLGQAKFRVWNNKVLLVYFVLASITIAAFWPATGFEFINFDDGKYVVDNPHIQAGFSCKSLEWAFTTGYDSNWFPVTWLSHILDFCVYGLHAGGHHFTNVLLHTANVLLLFGWLRRATGAMWSSALVAALFAWHPLHVESVAWVSERKDVLSTFFALLTLWAYWFYTKGLNWRRYCVALLCYAVGLMCKPMLVSLPLLLLLLDCWPLKRFATFRLQGKEKARSAMRRASWLAAEKAPFFILSAISCYITIQVQVLETGHPASNLTLDERIVNTLNAYTRYTGKLVWPQNLSVFYPYPHHSPVVPALWGGAALALIIAWSLFQAGKRPYLVIGWLWFLISLIPVIGLVPVGGQSMADRYTYIPSIGFFVAVVWGLADLLGSSLTGKRVLWAATMVILFGCLVGLPVRVLQDGVTVDVRQIGGVLFVLQHQRHQKFRAGRMAETLADFVVRLNVEFVLLRVYLDGGLLCIAHVLLWF